MAHYTIDAGKSYFQISGLNDWNTNDTILPNSETIAISGEMIEVEYLVSDMEMAQKLNLNYEDKIKDELMILLLQKLRKSNKISFTRYVDNITGMCHFKARIFATPDNKVREIVKIRTI